RDQVEQQPCRRRAARAHHQRHGPEQEHAPGGAVIGEPRRARNHANGRDGRTMHRLFFRRWLNVGGELDLNTHQGKRPSSVPSPPAMTGDPLQDRDYEALAAFRYELRRFLRFSEEAAIAAGLTPQHYQVLLALRASPGGGMMIGALADRLMLRPHSTTE